MKRTVLTALLASALLLNSPALHAKRGGFSFSKSSSLRLKPSASANQGFFKQKSSRQQSQADATFANTRARSASYRAARLPFSGSNLFTGMMAGYLLSNLLAPSSAHANANANNDTQTTFAPLSKSDPALIIDNETMKVWCLNNVQYFSLKAQASAPAPLVGKDGKPLQCHLQAN